KCPRPAGRRAVPRAPARCGRCRRCCQVLRSELSLRLCRPCGLGAPFHYPAGALRACPGYLLQRPGARITEPLTRLPSSGAAEITKLELRLRNFLSSFILRQHSFEHGLLVG